MLGDLNRFSHVSALKVDQTHQRSWTAQYRLSTALSLQKLKRPYKHTNLKLWEPSDCNRRLPVINFLRDRVCSVVAWYFPACDSQLQIGSLTWEPPLFERKPKPVTPSSECAHSSKGHKHHCCFGTPPSAGETMNRKRCGTLPGSVVAAYPQQWWQQNIVWVCLCLWSTGVWR